MDTATETKTPITILDYVKSKVGEKETYSYADHADNGVPMLGGCYGCAASLATYNMHPGKNGYIHCADCIGENGYATAEEFGQTLTESDDGEHDCNEECNWDEGDLGEYDGYDAEYED